MRPARRLRLGSYELVFELAAGGMAKVYVARQLGAAGFERLVAVKRVHPHLLDNREFYDMFRDEARVSSLIRHPNVVSASDVVEARGELFLVMDYVESVSLSRLCDRRAVPPRIAARILADVLAGLHAAHEAVDLHGRPLDVVHRDVSPQNVIVGVDGSSRLIDFGIAKAAARLAATSGLSLRGKLRYMAPEQVKQQPLDRRADLFAAGVVLYELLTGARLFEGEDEADIVLGVLVGTVRRPSEVVEAVPPDLDDVVLRALARARDERFATAADMQAALERACPPATPREIAAWVDSLVGGELAERRARLRAALAGEVEAFGDAAKEEEETIASVSAPPPPRRSRRGLAAAAAAFTAAVGLSAVAFMRPPKATAPTVPADAAVFAGATTPPIAASPPAAASAPAPPPSSDSVPVAGPNGSLRNLRTSPRPAARPRATVDLHRNPYGQ